MPIVRNGKVVAQVEREAIHESTIAAVNNKNLDSMNEILIVKKTPQEFNDLAYQIAKKGSSIFRFKDNGVIQKRPPAEYVKAHPRKSRFDFIVDVPSETGWVESYAKYIVKYGLLGIFSIVWDEMPTDNHLDAMKRVKVYTDKINNILKSCGLKASDVYGRNYYKYSKDKKFVYVAWPAICRYGSDIPMLQICVECSKANNFNNRFVVGNRNQDVKYDEAATGYRPEDIFVQETSSTTPIRSDFYTNKPMIKKTLNEYLDLSDTNTRKTLLTLDEAGHNSVLTKLTSNLYDHIVKKSADIDFGEIPNTKGDVTKLAEYEDLVDVMETMRNILKEYHQDTKPVDVLTTALANIRTRKDMFEKAFRYDCELPMLMYNTVVMSIVNGISYLIAASIEFIKAPKDESFTIALDKVAYAKTKDHLMYTSLEKFNKSCEKGDFDKAMGSIIDQRVRKFTGTVVGVLVGSTVGIILILNIIPIMRELVYILYATRMKIADFFEVQADLLQMNTYNLEHNNTIDADRRKEIIDDQMEIANKFRMISNAVTIDAKKTDVEVSKELQSSNKKYKIDELEDEVEIASDDDSGSALF